MITSITRQSIIIKCNMQASVMLGNYEFYYAAGLFCKLQNITVEEEIAPMELWEKILPYLQNFIGEDAKEKYLVKLLSNYKVLEDYDEQMKELLQMGLNEEHMWQVNI
ncbi:MAG: DUF3837 domain-containing protein [Lachnospiraceae bacterium]|nr:DUF3837 domain-containing protein [Lachnospiraceae bacterium]